MNRASIGILYLPNRRWSEPRKTAASLAPRLAKDFPLVWVTPAHHWRQIGERLRSGRDVFSWPEDGLGATVYEPPPHLPMTHRPAAAARWLRARRLAQARSELLRQGAEKIVLYNWRPRYSNTLDLVEHDASIYHIVDEYSFSSDDPPTSPEERRLIDEVDRLIVHSPALLEKKGRAGPTAFIPNGVDFASFATPCPEPSDLAGIPHPRIGYCGYLKHQMDWDLLETLVDRHPDLSWVFVGQLRHEDLASRVSAFGRRPNVYLLGAKATDELARYPQHFDVCIMPYVRDGYTRYIYPLKLHEYLAAGRPTVGTPIRTLQEFDGVVELAVGVDAWSVALRRSLDPAATSDALRELRQTVAHKHDWDVLAEDTAAVIEEAVASGRAAGKGRTAAA